MTGLRKVKVSSFVLYSVTIILTRKLKYTHKAGLSARAVAPVYMSRATLDNALKKTKECRRLCVYKPLRQEQQISRRSPNSLSRHYKLRPATRFVTLLTYLLAAYALHCIVLLLLSITLLSAVVKSEIKQGVSSSDD